MAVRDGRETARREIRPAARARPGDVDDAIRVIDRQRRVSFLCPSARKRGRSWTGRSSRTQPRLLLELGTYCGYSALRMARVMPREARLYSVEFNTANAEIARRILAHAGVDDKSDRHRRDAWRRRRNDPHSEA